MDIITFVLWILYVFVFALKIFHVPPITWTDVGTCLLMALLFSFAKSIRDAGKRSKGGIEGNPVGSHSTDPFSYSAKDKLTK